MKCYLFYFKYVLRHKWFVMRECFKYKLYWQGIIHDLSKFRLSEFIPYSRYFYNRDGTPKQIRNETGDLTLDYAWLLHQHRNPHHWQYWVLKEDEGGTKTMEMPHKFLLEMWCDWMGAGKARGMGDIVNWYEENKNRILLAPVTRGVIESMVTATNIRQG